MKHFILYLLLATLIFSSCLKEYDGLISKPITLVVNTKNYTLVELYFMGDNIIIDWGDGETETCSSSGDYLSYMPHVYKERSNDYVIKISTGKLTNFKYDQDVTGGVDVVSIDFGECPVLKTVELSHMGYIKNIDFAGCPALETLGITYSRDLEKVDLSEIQNLIRLSCMFNSELESIILGENPKLTYIQCYNNPKLSYVDVDHLSSLKSFSVRNNGFGKEVLN